LSIRDLVVVMITLFSFSFLFTLSHVQGQLPECPNGYIRSPNGNCETHLDLSGLPRCPNGYQRNSDGFCFPIISTQSCPVGYQRNILGTCIPVSGTASQFVKPFGYPTTASTDTNQTLSMLSNLTGGLLQNSTNSSLPVNDSNATNQTQIQKAPVTGSQQQGQPQQQPPPQSYPYAPPYMQQPQQQQPLLQAPPPSSQLPFNTVPMNPSGSLPYYFPPLSQPTETPPRILSDNNYFSSTGTLHIVGEIINESFEPVRFVKIIATFYDSNNSVIGTDFTYTTPSTLQPGQKAPFDILVTEGSMPLHLVAYYTLSVDY
jgi:hypothetical protein